MKILVIGKWETFVRWINNAGLPQPRIKRTVVSGDIHFICAYREQNVVGIRFDGIIKLSDWQTTDLVKFGSHILTRIESQIS